MRRACGLVSAWLALSLGLIGCSSLTPVREPSIPEGQCIVSGISTRTNPDLEAQARAMLQASGVSVSAVVGADRGEASACGRGGYTVTTFTIMDRIVAVTVPVVALSDAGALGESAAQVASALQLSAGAAGPLQVTEVSMHFLAGTDARLVRMSAAKVQAAEAQRLSGAAYLAAVDGI